MFRIRGKVNTSAWRKLDKIRNLEAGFGAELARNVSTIRDNMSKDLSRRYPESEEIETLMKGIVSSGKHAGQKVGTSEGGRLILSSFKPLWDIVAEESIHTKTSQGYVKAWFGDLKKMNRKAEFQYQRGSGQVFTAKPFGGMYVESAEYGGVWDVEPRADSVAHMLHPEDGLLVKRMRKEIRPKGFVAYAERTGRLMIKNNLIKYGKRKLGGL